MSDLVPQPTAGRVYREYMEAVVNRQVAQEHGRPMPDLPPLTMHEERDLQMTALEDRLEEALNAVIESAKQR